MEKTTLLTCDVGTSGVKAALFDAKGVLVAAVTKNIKTYYDSPLFAEQRPEDFWRGTVEGIRELLALCEAAGYEDMPERIAAIGLSGHMNGLLPVDREGEPVYNHILHSDLRTGDICRRLRTIFLEKSYYDITGNRIDPHYSLPKILWLKEERPELEARTAHYLGSKDYLLSKLIGKPGLTDRSDASLTGLLDIHTGNWAEAIAAELQIDKSKLSEVHRGTEIAGPLTREAAESLGLLSGTPVSVGGGDGACAALGAGIYSPGMAYNCLGSTSWISVLSDRPILDEQMRCFSYFDLTGDYTSATGTVQSATSSFDWAAKNVGGFDLEDGDSFSRIQAMIASVPRGSEKLFFLPYLSGERTPYWDESLRGAFIGLCSAHGAAHMLRSVCEGVAYSLDLSLRVFADNGNAINELILLGGGGRNSLWSGILADVFGIPLRLHSRTTHATALGAAIAAGVGAGVFKNAEEGTKRLVQINERIEPVKENALYYASMKPLYAQLAPTLTAFYHKLNDR